MTASRDFIFGRWRAVLVLGVTQILQWGAIFYTPVLVVPLIAADRGWSISFAMGGFSFGLLAGGLSAPIVGRSIDRFGGHVVMGIGSLVGAAGLALITMAAHPAAYYGVWIVLGVGMAAGLYDPAFATLGRIFGTGARRAITLLTLAGGFASTVSWPVTHHLLVNVGWQRTYLIYAAVLAVICAPLHAFLLPRERFDHAAAPLPEGVKPHRIYPPHGLIFLLVAAAFTTYAFVPSGMSAHLLAIFKRAGIDAATVVWIGALFGPAQVGARILELTFGGNMHPVWIGRIALTLLLCAFAMLALLGFSVPVAAAFALMFGAANGLITIARGAVPLALFGAAGYGRLMGRLAMPFLLMQAAAPLVMAFVVERFSDPAALSLTAAFAAVALACFVLIRRPA
ncbi:MAG: MFS transporter [Pseudolabrys sp.]|nr:MFS transporter [Pseudolabrys sp.]MBV9956362.1 MFS transporter [Pseudolabrys sp.]